MELAKIDFTLSIYRQTHSVLLHGGTLWSSRGLYLARTEFKAEWLHGGRNLHLKSRLLHTTLAAVINDARHLRERSKHVLY